MADETTTAELAPEPDKSEIVCPVSLKFGHVQNYRCTWRKNRAVWESRPVAGTDKWAAPFFEYLRKPKEEGGLGQSDAQAAKFTHEMGVKARAKAVEMVNSGQIKAPKKNWDANFGPRRTVEIEGRMYEIGGGKPLDELKKEFPELYGTTTTTKKQSQTEDESVITDDTLSDKDLDDELEASDAADAKRASEESETTAKVGPEPMSDEELAKLPDQIEGEGDRSPVEEEAYAVETVEDTPAGMISEEDLDVGDLIVGKEDDEEEPAEGEYHLKMRAPQGVAQLNQSAVRFTDKDNNERTYYRIIHPTSGHEVLCEEGMNEIDGAIIELEIVRTDS